MNQLNLQEYSVSELSGSIKRTLEDAYGYVRVRGELGGVTRPASGHIYLDLKDDKAVLNGVVWKGQALRLKIAPEQGLEVVCTGRLTTFPGQSRYQLIIEEMEPAGVGALMALLEERRKKLAAEGLFDTAHKKELPFLPEVIGVVTSPTGAVIRDILHRLHDRFPRHVLVWPALVQGEKAAAQIAEGIAGFNALPREGPVPRPDVLIVARGGGSIEDLWAFNEEIVVRAAYASKIPLISAVGHETDTTLIDFAADRWAPTPTAAAEMAVPVRSELIAQIAASTARLVRAAARGLDQRDKELRALARGLPKPDDIVGLAAQRLDHAGARLVSCLTVFVERRAGDFARRARLGPQPLRAALRHKNERLAAQSDRLIRTHRQSLLQAEQRLGHLGRSLSRRTLQTGVTREFDRLSVLSRRLDSGFQRVVREKTERLTARSQLLRSFSYESVLQRGFALVQAEDGVLIRKAAELATGEAVRLRFADGDRRAIIDDQADLSEKSPQKAEPAQAPKKSRDTQGTLF